MRLFHSLILSACLLITVIALNILQDRYYQKRFKAQTITTSKASATDIVTNIQQITFYNAITKKDIGHKHWTGTYHPTTFALHINNTLLEPETDTTIQVTDNCFELRIDYSFMNGYKKGAIIATYELTDTSCLQSCTFNKWKTDARIDITGARYVSHTDDDFDASMKDIICYRK